MQSKMTTLIHSIDNDCFGSALNQKLFEIRFNNQTDNGVNSFIKLFKQTLNENSEIKNDDFLNDYSWIDDILNIEIKARWREYLSLKFPKQKKEHLRKSVSLYLEVFSLTKNIDYLIHPLRLVKKVKGLFKENIPDFYELGKLELLRLDKPFIQKEIVCQLFSFDPEQTKTDFGYYFRSEIKKQTIKNNYSSVYWLIEALKEIKSISKIESRILHATNYENEGDHLVECKKPNTYYPTILEKYQLGLKELKGLECDDILRKRIERKVSREQNEQVLMHCTLSQHYLGTNTVFNSIIDDFSNACIKEFKVCDFESGLNSLISFPICFESLYETKTEGSLFSILFDDYNRIDSKGKVVGKTNKEHFDEIQSRRMIRECIINFIKKAKWIMDEDKKLSKDDVFFHVLNKCDSKFIPADRQQLFVNGIYSGFNNDFITSAHILIPQFENSLRYVLDNNDIITSKIYSEIQHDKMLGGILDIFIEKSEGSIFYELKDFLLDNSSVNFRNELCHGLLSPFIIEHYGIYVWWLTLKLILNVENILEIKSTKR
ncbi:hypothetical protein MHTCC0001_35260 [Flavobacteriaceae bacterium MHTCC 0001]